jgi:hypothetical protein
MEPVPNVGGSTVRINHGSWVQDRDEDIAKDAFVHQPGKGTECLNSLGTKFNVGLDPRTLVKEMENSPISCGGIVLER